MLSVQFGAVHNDWLSFFGSFSRCARKSNGFDIGQVCRLDDPFAAFVAEKSYNVKFITEYCSFSDGSAAFGTATSVDRLCQNSLLECGLGWAAATDRKSVV